MACAMASTMILEALDPNNVQRTLESRTLESPHQDKTKKFVVCDAQ